MIDIRRIYEGIAFRIYEVMKNNEEFERKETRKKPPKNIDFYDLYLSVSPIVQRLIE